MTGTRIGLFGGTFNPVHKGHTAIVEAFLNSDVIDKLWILLTPFPPHKTDKTFAPYKQRLEMLKVAFAGLNNVTISNVEQDLPQPNYTLQTIRHLKARYPENQFFYCMGSDSLTEFNKWMNYDSILEECELLVAKRPHFDISAVEEGILQRTHIVKHIPLDFSSTQIRQNIASGKSIGTLVPEKVREIIEKENLYR